MAFRGEFGGSRSARAGGMRVVQGEGYARVLGVPRQSLHHTPHVSSEKASDTGADACDQEVRRHRFHGRFYIGRFGRLRSSKVLDLLGLLVAFGFLLALVWLIAYPLPVPPKNRRMRSVTACYLIAMLCNHSTYVSAEMFGHDARGARGGNVTTVSASRHDPSSSWLAGATIGGEAARVNVEGHLAKAKSQKADIASPSASTIIVPGVAPHRSAPFLAVSYVAHELFRAEPLASHAPFADGLGVRLCRANLPQLRHRPEPPHENGARPPHGTASAGQSRQRRALCCARHGDARTRHRVRARRSDCERGEDRDVEGRIDDVAVAARRDDRAEGVPRNACAAAEYRKRANRRRRRSVVQLRPHRRAIQSMPRVSGAE